MSERGADGDFSLGPAIAAACCTFLSASTFCQLIDKLPRGLMELYSVALCVRAIILIIYFVKDKGSPFTLCFSPFTIAGFGNYHFL